MANVMTPAPADTILAHVPERLERNSNLSQRSLSILSIYKANPPCPGSDKKVSLAGIARHTLGIGLLLITVVFWTASNFLASSIFADNTYSKPFFVVYVTSLFFSTLLIFDLLRRSFPSDWLVRTAFADKKDYDRDEDLLRASGSSSSSYLLAGERRTSSNFQRESANKHSENFISVRETAKLSFQFSLIWFAANYFASACLEYTTVASTTIFTSTSSIWTLVFGALLRVEVFSFKKLLGVIASFVGILLISGVDISGDHDKDRGSFPHKSPGSIAVGDALALTSAILYGIYATIMKKGLVDEGRVNMSLFFGFVGFFNVITMLPGFPILHFIGIERFRLPPTKRVVMIILINSAISLASDICWAYAMLLTSPLVVTVGLSLTIPLSLIGQIFLNSQTSSGIYWFGALVVLLSFIFINHESRDQAEISSQESRNEFDVTSDNNVH
ncbi:MAG: hypothetical protein Q9195_003448 [Heterodermia aff. obscurata]